MREYDTMRVYNSLKVLRKMTEKPVELKLAKEFCTRERGLNTYIIQVLTKKGIIKIVKKGQPNVYQWNTIEPNERMAFAVINEAQKIGVQYRQKNKKSAKIQKTTDMNDKKYVEVNNSEKSLLESIKESGETATSVMTIDRSEFVEFEKTLEERSKIIQNLEKELSITKEQLSNLEARYLRDLEKYQEMFEDLKKQYDSVVSNSDSRLLFMPPDMIESSEIDTNNESAFYKRSCKHCSKEFIARRSDKIFCSTRCKSGYTNDQLRMEKTKSKKESKDNSSSDKGVKLMWGLISINW